MSLDDFHKMRADRDIPSNELQAEIDRTARGFHLSVAGMASAGNNVIVDHVLAAEWRLPHLLSLLPPENVVFVGVHCHLEELARRELERGNREPGLAARQYQLVHADKIYDIDVDTSISTPEECAAAIKTFLHHRPKPTAFQRLLNET